MELLWLEHYSFIAIHWEHCNKKEKKKNCNTTMTDHSIDIKL